MKLNSLSIKFPLIGVLVLFLSLGVLSWRLYHSKKSELINVIGQEIQGVASTAVLSIDADKHENIYFDEDENSIGDEKYFNELKNHLLKVKEANRLKSALYTMRRHPEKSGWMEFVVMTDLNKEGKPYVGNGIHGNQYIKEVYETGNCVITPVYEDSEGTWISAIAPILDKEGTIVAVLHVDRDLDYIEVELSKMLKNILGIVGLAMIVGVLIFFILTLKVIRNLKLLSAGTNRMAAGDLEHRLNVNSNDEVGELADAFNQMGEKLSSSLVSRKYVENVLANISSGVLVVESDESLHPQNISIERLTGYCGEEFKELEIIQLLPDLVSSDLLAKPINSMETELLNKQKVKIPVLISATQMKDEDSDKTRTVIVINDFTELKKAQQKIEKTNSELEDTLKELRRNQAQLIQAEKMASVGQLAAGVAHEVNNPIGFVKSNIQSMKEYINDVFEFVEESKNIISKGSEITQEDVDKIEDLSNKLDLDFIREDAVQLVDESDNGLERVREIVQRLRDFSNIDSTDEGEVDLNQSLDNAVKLSEQYLNKGIRVDQKFSDNLPQYLCRPAELNEAFMNIIKNACQAMPEGGTLTITTDLSNKEILIGFQDTGNGISEQNTNQIFTPFFTTHAVGSGTGLGLTTAYNALQRLGGDIKVESKEGEGSTFTLHLPLKS